MSVYILYSGEQLIVFLLLCLSLCRSGRSIDQTDDDDRADRHIYILNSLLDALLCYVGVTKRERKE